jgi:hypothetical protein
MAVSLRIVTEKLINVDQALLSPKIGCGLMLSRIPRYSPNDVLREVIQSYDYETVFADKQAAKFLDSNESLVRSFCSNAEGSRMPIKVNYKAAFGLKDVFLVLDLNAKSAYFIQAPENKLALNNYYRDVMPGLMQSFGVALSGSTNRLTPVGWQSLHDLMTDGDFRSDFPDVEKIEIMSTLSTSRWRKPVAEIGVNMLNLSDPKSIRQGLFKEVRKVP